MSEVLTGCSGKLPFSWLSALQRRLRGSDQVWADAENLPPLSLGLMSIDTVVVDDEDLPNSVVLAILHSMNDVFAAGGMPTAFSLSLTLSGRPNLGKLQSLTAAISDFSIQSEVSIGKLHTTVDCHTSRATVACVGQLVSTHSTLPAEGGVWLVDSLKALAEAAPKTSPMWVRERLMSRRGAVECVPGPKKDVSGDGLAGAAYQLATQYHCAISLELSSFASQFAGSPVDSCTLDRNYADFSGLLHGFKGRDVAWLRSVLFEPQFFGPLLCLSEYELRCATQSYRKIGSFVSGDRSVSII